MVHTNFFNKCKSLAIITKIVSPDIVYNVLSDIPYVRDSSHEDFEYRIGILYRERPMSAMVGATVIGPTKRRRRPTNPVPPIRISTRDAAMMLPESYKEKNKVETPEKTDNICRNIPNKYIKINIV